MEYPEVRISEKQEKTPMLFQTHQIEFKIADKKYELHVQTSAGTAKNGYVAVDILDIVKLVVNDEPCNPSEVGKTLSNIHSLFGREWYEKWVIEEAHKGWSEYINSLASHNEDKEPIKWDEKVADLLSCIENDIEHHCYDDFVELSVHESGSDVKISKEVDNDSITRELMSNIKHTVEDFFKNIE